MPTQNSQKLVRKRMARFKGLVQHKKQNKILNEFG